MIDITRIKANILIEMSTTQSGKYDSIVTAKRKSFLAKRNGRPPLFPSLTT